MSVEAYFRIIFAIVAIIMAGVLTAKLITGRSRVRELVVDRGAEPGVYWGSVGLSFILVIALAIAATLPTEQPVLAIVFLGLIGGQVFEMLVSGTVHMATGSRWTRSSQPRQYWRWVVVHIVVIGAIATLFFLQLMSSTTP